MSSLLCQIQKQIIPKQGNPNPSQKSAKFRPVVTSRVKQGNLLHTSVNLSSEVSKVYLNLWVLESQLIKTRKGFYTDILLVTHFEEARQFPCLIHQQRCPSLPKIFLQEEIPDTLLFAAWHGSLSIPRCNTELTGASGWFCILTLCSTFVCWVLSKCTLISLVPSRRIRILFPTISAGKHRSSKMLLCTAVRVRLKQIKVA